MSSGHGEVWIGVLARCYMECNTVGELGQFNSNPGLGHWKAVQHVLKGTTDLGFVVNKQTNKKITEHFSLLLSIGN